MKTSNKTAQNNTNYNTNHNTNHVTIIIIGIHKLEKEDKEYQCNERGLPTTAHRLTCCWLAAQPRQNGT
jgi:hypothetical protein